MNLSEKFNWRELIDVNWPKLPDDLNFYQISRLTGELHMTKKEYEDYRNKVLGTPLP
jgi:hypothetical protein